MSSIKKTLLTGIFWSAIEKYSSFIVTIIISMILARLLPPELYGEVAIAYIMIGFLSMISSMGMGPAIIQNRDLSKSDLNIIFTFSLYIALLLVGIFFFSAWLIASFYHNPNLVFICHILCITLFFGTLNMVPHALMAKNQKFKAIAKRTLIFQFISGGLSIFAAFSGWGVYALLISPVVSSIGIFFYNLHMYPLRFTRHLSFVPIKKIASFSAFQFAFDIFNYFSVNLDKMLIGKYLSASSLGYYEKSYRLAQMPIGQIVSVVHPVLQPVLATLHENVNLISEKYNKIIKFLSTISFPVSILLYTNGYEIINIFYGDKWNASIPSFCILSLALPTHMILCISGSIWQACNRTDYMFWTGMVNTTITITGFIVAASYWGTIESLAYSWTITAIINFMNTHTIMYLKVLKASILEMLKMLIFPLINAMLLYGLLRVMTVLLTGCPILILLLIKMGVGIVFTFVFVQLSGRYDLVSMIRNRKLQL